MAVFKSKIQVLIGYFFVLLFSVLTYIYAIIYLCIRLLKTIVKIKIPSKEVKND